MKGGRRLADREPLVEGLNHHERIALLENAVPKLWKQYEEQRREIADLKFELNRLAMPWWLRWLVRRKR